MTLTHLQPVLETLQWLKNETNVWFEITNLMIPTLNDDPAETRKLAEWILEHLGPDVPLHFTAFHPDFKLRDKPNTPPETLARGPRHRAAKWDCTTSTRATSSATAPHTSCPSCKTLLIRRSWHDVQQNRLKDGALPQLRPRHPRPLVQPARPNPPEIVRQRARCRRHKVRPPQSLTR